MLTLIKRIGLAILGEILPETAMLSKIVHDIQRAFLATLITGIFIAAFFLLACFAFYSFLTAKGMTEGLAMGSTLGVLLILTLISGLIAKKYLSRIKKAKEKLTISSQKDAPAQVSAILSAFIDGLCQPDRPDRKEHDPQ